MTEFLIDGGTPLQGEVEIPGSKNASLAILSAVLLAKGTTILHNVPLVSDTLIEANLLSRFGAKVEWHEGSLFIDCTDITAADADEETVRAIRTSFYLLGPLLARVGHATMPAPGGCRIGARPVDLHLKGLALLGADVVLDGGVYIGHAGRLRGSEIYLDLPSAGATQHLMATAALVEGPTVIENAAIEPEVTALASCLNQMGARIEGAGTNKITITGVKELHGCEFRIPSDRLQAGTYLLAGAITGGDVTALGILPDEQTALVNKLKESGAVVSEGPDWLRVAAPRRLKGINIKTMPYPGFPTDMQQVMAAVLALADGTSVVDETIYESRIGHVQELNRMGGKLRVEGRSTIVTGVEHLKGAVVEATDLRAGAALCLAGLAAQGRTTVRNVHYIDRGYEKFEQRLRSLGADIERVDHQEQDAARPVTDNPTRP
jgi:UDP-N-acetylglucosamine 1-carboxyvinyltransferase